jgi:hypothetical protein
MPEVPIELEETRETVARIRTVIWTWALRLCLFAAGVNVLHWSGAVTIHHTVLESWAADVITVISDPAAITVVGAFVVGVCLHEGCHVAAARYFGGSPRIHPLHCGEEQSLLTLGPMVSQPLGEQRQLSPWQHQCVALAPIVILLPIVGGMLAGIVSNPLAGEPSIMDSIILAGIVTGLPSPPDLAIAYKGHQELADTRAATVNCTSHESAEGVSPPPMTLSAPEQADISYRTALTALVSPALVVGFVVAVFTGLESGLVSFGAVFAGAFVGIAWEEFGPDIAIPSRPTVRDIVPSWRTSR